MNHIPGFAKKRLITSKWFIESVTSVPAVVVAGIAAYRLFDSPQTVSLAWLSVAAAGWLTIALILKILSAHMQDIADHKAKDHGDIRAAMHVLHAAVAGACSLNMETRHERLRATFHRVVPPIDQPEQMEQITPYVGGSNNGAGRSFSIRSGVTGKAVRERSPYVYHRMSGDDAACKRELKEQWGYTDRDIKSLTEGRYSAIAIPVTDVTGQHTVGVIYFDSDEKSLFREKKRQTAIVTACSGLSKYISERYST